MTRFSKINRALLIFNLMLAVTLSSSSAIAVNNNSEDVKHIASIDGQTIKPLVVNRQVNPYKIYYKNVSKNSSQGKSVAVFVGNKQIIKFAHTAGGLTPEERAKIFSSRLESFIKQGGNAIDILPGMKDGIPVIRANKEILFTADHKTAKYLGLRPSGLALQTVNNIRSALGAPRIVRSNTFISSRGSISTAFTGVRFGRLETGLASWYGGQFHGRRAADGSRFNTHDFTAAHKTLPFGSVVRVTNLRNGKFCFVRITDRGPFVRGRVIDLSKAAAKEIGMLSSGVSRVKLEVLAEY